MTPQQRDHANVRDAMRLMRDSDIAAAAIDEALPAWARRIYAAEQARRTLTNLAAAARGVDALLTEMQSAVGDYLPPDGITASELIGKLIYLLDGPEQRAAQGNLQSALARAEGLS